MQNRETEKQKQTNNNQILRVEMQLLYLNKTLPKKYIFISNFVLPRLITFEILNNEILTLRSKINT